MIKDQLYANCTYLNHAHIINESSTLERDLKDTVSSERVDCPNDRKLEVVCVHIKGA